MLSIQERGFEVIFDPIAKSAILRRNETLIWLDGPCRHMPKRSIQRKSISKTRTGRFREIGRTD